MISVFSTLIVSATVLILAFAAMGTLAIICKTW